jgi:hypothetical protein
MATVAEIKKMAKDQVIMEFKGKIKNFYPLSDKPDNYGNFKQTVTLEDFSGELMQFQFTNHPEITKQDMGQVILIQSQNIPKRGFQGMKYSPYNSSVKGMVQNVSVTKSALVQIGETIPAAEPSPDYQQEESIQSQPIVKEKDLSKERAMAISYAKDLVIADKIQVGTLYHEAENITKFIASGTIPETDEVPFGE